MPTLNVESLEPSIGGPIPDVRGLIDAAETLHRDREQIAENLERTIAHHERLISTMRSHLLKIQGPRTKPPEFNSQPPFGHALQELMDAQGGGYRPGGAPR